MAVGEERQRVPRWPGTIELNPIIATVTPFTGDRRVDIGALRAYLGFLNDVGVRAILVNGTTGEFAGLTVAERKSVLEHARAHWPGHLIAHIGATAAGDALELLHHAHDHADAVATIAPYFFADPPEAGLRDYFGQLLALTKLPMLLYNFPRHTQTPITPELFRHLADQHPMLAGIKDSGSDRAVTRAYTATSLPVFVGDDGAAARIADLGVQGIVSGGGNPVPELPVRIAAALRVGDTENAQRWQSVFDECRSLRRESGLSDIAFVKAALGERIPGFPTTVLPPLTASDEPRIDEIRTYLRHKVLPRVREEQP
ncbi:dihydrodipicolinate synthase family protein [Nocardia niigatensis]